MKHYFSNSSILLLLFSLLLTGCSPAANNTLEQTLEGNTMGTTYSVKFYSQQPVDNQALQQLIDQELELINDLMSTYRPESELMRFNQLADTAFFTLSEQTAKVVAEAIRIGQQSGGVLDITVGPLVELWGFGASGRITERPATITMAAIQHYVGLEKISLVGNQLSKIDPRMAIDLSTIAKGYGVDQIAAILENHDINDYLVDIGGEMRLKGSKPDRAWRIAIEKPVAGQRSMQRILEPGNMAVATSGDYRNYFEQDGIRYSHLIDPRTGAPIQHRTVSSTVLHVSSMTADGYATALHIMDASEALQFANQHDIAALLIVKTDEGYTELVSNAFQPFIDNEKR
jgi:thiamine biosynthesis lipoprotein